MIGNGVGVGTGRGGVKAENSEAHTNVEMARRIGEHSTLEGIFG